MATKLKVTAGDFLQLIRSGGSMCLWNEAESRFMLLKGNGRYISMEFATVDVPMEHMSEILADLAHAAGTDFAKKGESK